MSSSILIAGDRSEFSRALGDFLSNEGFDVTVATGAAEALDAVSMIRPDLALIDLDLPILGALDVGLALRSESDWPQLPLVYVRREGSGSAEKIAALERGADEVLVEPYELRELLARIRALARRGAAPPRSLSAGGITVDDDEHRVVVGDREVTLTSKEFGLLKYLLGAGGRVIRREELLEKVWLYGGAAEIESRTLDVHIRRLRQKLDPEALRIVTVRGVGYRFDVSPDGP